MKTIEVTAPSFDDAVELALEELGLSAEMKDLVTFKIVKESGIIRKKITVSATYEEAPVIEEVAQEDAVESIYTQDDLALDEISLKAQKTVEDIIKLMGFNTSVFAEETENGCLLNLEGEDTDKLIGYRGETIDALQYITLLIANKNSQENKKITINGDNYREKRVATLTKLAKNSAFRASKTGVPFKFEPMNPFERRIIHSALHDDAFVTTTSEGVEPYRYVVIVPNRKREQRREGGFNRNSQGSRGGRSNYDRPNRYERRDDRPKTPITPSTSNLTEVSNDNMYDDSANKDFSKKGFGKTRSFGNSRKKNFF